MLNVRQSKSSMEEVMQALRFFFFFQKEWEGSMEGSYSRRIFFNQAQFSSYIFLWRTFYFEHIREIYTRHNFREHSLYYVILLSILLSRSNTFLLACSLIIIVINN